MGEIARRSEQAYAPDVLAASARGVVRSYFDPTRSRLWKQAAMVQAPTLLIYGGRDKLVDPRMSKRAMRTYPRADLLMLPHVGHVAMMENPDEVASAIKIHLQRSASGRHRRAEVPRAL